MNAHASSADSAAADLPVACQGMTADCVSVQGDVAQLIRLLADAPPADAGADVLAEFCRRALQAIRRARRDLCEHCTRIEGPAGLFAYLDEGAAQLGLDVCQLCQQHCAITRCLERLEEQVSPDLNDVGGRRDASGDACDPAALEPLRAAGPVLADLMRAHQESLTHLVAAVTAVASA